MSLGDCTGSQGSATLHESRGCTGSQGAATLRGSGDCTGSQGPVLPLTKDDVMWKRSFLHTVRTFLMRQFAFQEFQILG